MKSEYYKSIDGIRAIAALFVMLIHFFNMTDNNTYLLKIIFNLCKIGQTGVTIFFVLSGFLITKSLLKKGKQDYFLSFYSKRALRIFPLYFVFLLIYYFVRPIILNLNFSIINPQYYFVFLQNIALTFNIESTGPGHFWSLAVQEHFYLVWPAIVFFSNKKQLKSIIIFITIGSLFLRFYMLAYGFSVAWFTFTRLDALAMGAYLAIYVFFDDNVIKKSYLISVILILTFCNILSYIVIHPISFNLFQTIKYTLWSVTLCYGILFLINYKTFLNKLLSIRFLTYTGKISYGLYVFHFLVFDSVFFYFENIEWYYKFITSFVLCYVIASISYRVIEKPFLNLKKSFN